MKVHAVVHLTLLFFVFASPAFAQTTTQSLNFGGEQRTYIVHSPLTPTVSARPLLIVFHGANGTGEGIEQITGMDAIADRHGFVVVYPNSAGSKWRIDLSAKSDLKFAEALIAELTNSGSIDPQRVYIAGYSQGAGLAQGVACEDADKVSGIADISENLNPRFKRLCRPSRPMTFILFHGTADPISPFNGGANGLSNAETFSAEDTAKFWSEVDGCRGGAVNSAIVDTLSTGQPTTVIKQSWGNCNGGSHVDFYTIPGGGHTWPGGAQKPNGRLGPTVQKLNASEIIWQAFGQ